MAGESQLIIQALNNSAQMILNSMRSMRAAQIQDQQIQLQIRAQDRLMAAEKRALEAEKRRAKAEEEKLVLDRAKFFQEMAEAQEKTEQAKTAQEIRILLAQIDAGNQAARNQNDMVNQFTGAVLPGRMDDYNFEERRKKEGLEASKRLNQFLSSEEGQAAPPPPPRALPAPEAQVEDTSTPSGNRIVRGIRNGGSAALESEARRLWKQLGAPGSSQLNPDIDTEAYLEQLRLLHRTVIREGGELTDEETAFVMKELINEIRRVAGAPGG